MREKQACKYTSVGVLTFAIAALMMVILAQVAQAGDWPMYRYDAAHSGATDETVEPPLEPLWKYMARDSIKSSPSVSADVVIFGSNDQFIYALDAKTGNLKWKYETGNYVQTSSAIYDGMVYIGSSDNYTYALDVKTGNLKWKYKTGNYIIISPVIYEDTVYIGSHDYYMYALDARTGNLKWKYKIGNIISGDPAVSEGVVYIGSSDSYVYALEAKTGTLKWEYSTDGTVDTPAVSEGVVYIGSSDSYVYALEAKTGSLKWKYKTDNDGDVFSPAVSKGVVYIGSYSSSDSYVYALDAKTGNLKWRSKTIKYITTPPLVSADIVYIGDNSYFLYAFDAKTGDMKWKYTTEYGFRSFVISGGILYAAIDKELTAFAPVHTPGAVLISSSPSGASIYLDESYQGTTPKTLADIPSGSHDILLRLKGYYNWSETVTVVSGQISNVTAEMNSDSSQTIEYSIFSIIALLIILATGVLIFIIYQKKVYRAKMKKWEKEGYDVSELKEVLEPKK